MLTTFMYGDIPALALSIFSVFFMMKYTETKKIKYGVFASLLTMIAYMMRMNTLIFVIATVMYLVLNLFKDFKQKEIKEKIINLAVIAIFLILTFVPSSLVKTYYLHKYNLEEGKTYPSISYFFMAMEEGPRANGWYNETIAEPALRSLKTGENISDEYKTKIKERLEYFTKNPGYTVNFYQKKLTTTWAESTYSALFNNGITEESNLKWIKAPLTFYQKALIILTFSCAIIVLIQKRKNLSLELIFLVIIFLGGFCFHILWEAKSRYIIPYIVVIIPIASIIISDERLTSKLKRVFKRQK
jgi:putative membrane protein